MTADAAGIRIDRDDPRYWTLVRGFNQRFQGAPQFVEVVEDAAATVAAVQRCLDERLRPTVRSGGHCYEGWSSLTDGVIIDVSLMNHAGRDPESGGYFVESGCTNWDLVNGLYRRYGVTLPGGSCYSVGAGGHISGGGYGMLSRLHGLTVDWLDAVELVTVRSGRAELVRVGRDSETVEERELFWAHTGGGGGNFGVITKYFFKQLPKAPPSAWLATLAWEWSDVVQHKDLFFRLIQNFARFFNDHSEPGSRYSALFAILHLRRVAGEQIALTVQHAAQDRRPLDEFLAALQQGIDPSRLPVALPKASVAGHRMIQPHPEVRQMPWLEVTQTENGSGANQRGKYKSAYMKSEFPQHQLEAMWNWLTVDSPTYPKNPLALLQIDSYGCAINAVATAATAVPQRSSVMKLQYQSYWADVSGDAENLAWIRGFYGAMYGPDGPQPDEVMDGCYVNYCDADLGDWATLYYKDSYPRLQKVKAEWDTHDVFNHAQSIRLPE
ncbi:MAG: FAD-binding protein [Ilumatobacteraceae bacterium]|nr:FAD-binding protein [Ilumatobacteraceae bacterium]